MSKTIGAALKTHFGADVTTIATCWRILRLDTTEFFFTDHDTDLIVNGDTYLASTGMLPSSLMQTERLNVDNMETVSFLDATVITEADLIAGLYDFATVDIFLVNYADLTQGELYLCQGWKLGEVEIRDNTAKAEIRGKAQLLQQNVVESFSPGCRATFGDSRCTVNTATYTVTGTATSVTDRRKFIDTSRTESTDVFEFGKLTWTSGAANDGYSMEVKSYNPATDEIELFEPMPNDIGVGDPYSLIQGCPKTLAACRDRFNNVNNFRGEPFIPGTDKLYDYRIKPTNVT